LKNIQNDSIGTRIENLDKHSIKMLVDESITLSKLTIKEASEIGEITATNTSV
jgi:hypothetical protein